MKTLNYFITALVIFLAALVVQPAASAEFAFDGNDAIVMRGQLYENDYFNKFLPLATKHVGEVKFLIMTSPGGIMYDAVLIGSYVHDAEINTVARGDCASACAYIWLGGSNRMYDINAHTILAFHLPYIADWVGWKAVKQYTLEEEPFLKDYLVEMGMNEVGMKAIPLGDPDPTHILYVNVKILKTWGIKALPYGR